PWRVAGVLLAGCGQRGEARRRHRSGAQCQRSDYRAGRPGPVAVVGLSRNVGRVMAFPSGYRSYRSFRPHKRSGMEWAGVLVRSIPWLAFLAGLIVGMALMAVW